MLSLKLGANRKCMFQNHPLPELCGLMILSPSLNSALPKFGTGSKKTEAFTPVLINLWHLWIYCFSAATKPSSTLFPASKVAECTSPGVHFISHGTWMPHVSRPVVTSPPFFPWSRKQNADRKCVESGDSAASFVWRNHSFSRSDLILLCQPFPG